MWITIKTRNPQQYKLIYWVNFNKFDEYNKNIIRKQSTYTQDYPQFVDNLISIEETVRKKNVNIVNTLEKQYIKRIESYQQDFRNEIEESTDQNM